MTRRRFKKQADIMRRTWYSGGTWKDKDKKNMSRGEKKKKNALWHQCPACVVSLMNPLISMTLMVDHFINKLWLRWQPWQRGRATGMLPQRLEPCHLHELREPPPQDPAWTDVYSHDKDVETICRKDVWLESGLNYYERYTWEHRWPNSPCCH